MLFPGAKLRSKSTASIPVLTELRSKIGQKIEWVCLNVFLLFFERNSLVKFYFSASMCLLIVEDKSTSSIPILFVVFLFARDEHDQRAGVVSRGLLLPSRQQRSRLGNGSGRSHEAPAVSGPHVALF